MQDVPVLLGHASIQTTERFYALWNKSRRDRLARVVREANGKDRRLEALRRSNNGRTVIAAPSGR